jgi:YegS/Rv2252/BmrU family lipid kinase
MRGACPDRAAPVDSGVKRITVVWNARAGGADDRAIDALREHFDVTVVATAAEALAARPEIVVAAGGDGTVSAVAAALVGGDVPLGILPCGTANSFASAVGVPLDPDAAVATLVGGERRVVDTARCGDRTMILHAMIGLHARTLAATTGDAKRRWGSLAYVASAVRELGDLTPFEVELVTEDRAVRCAAVAVAIANTAPTKTVLARGAGRAPPDDALLDVTIVSAVTIAELIATGVHLYRHAQRDEPATRDNVGYFSCRRVRVTASPPQHVLVDGEPAGDTPLEIECAPGSLAVIAPPAGAP